MCGKAKPRFAQTSRASISKPATPFYPGQRGLRHQSTHHGLDLGGLELEGALRRVSRVLRALGKKGWKLAIFLGKNTMIHQLLWSHSSPFLEKNTSDKCSRTQFWWLKSPCFLLQPPWFLAKQPFLMATKDPCSTCLRPVWWLSRFPGRQAGCNRGPAV